MEVCSLLAFCMLSAPYPCSRCQFLIKCNPHTVSIIFILQILICISSSSLSISFSSWPHCYHFNVVASSAVTHFLVMCQCAREVIQDQMLFFFLQLSSYSADAGGKKVEERERGPYYFSVEAADDTLMNLGRHRSPTHSHIHTPAPTQFMSLFLLLHFSLPPLL